MADYHVILCNCNIKSISSFSSHSEYLTNNGSPDSLENVMATNHTLFAVDIKITCTVSHTVVMYTCKKVGDTIMVVGVVHHNKRTFFNKRIFPNHLV